METNGLVNSSIGFISYIPNLNSGFSKILRFHWKALCPEPLPTCHQLVHREVTQSCDASYLAEAFSSKAFIYSLPGERKKD